MGDRNLPAVCDGFPHVDGRLFDFSVRTGKESQVLDAGGCLHIDFRILHQAVIVGIFADAADAVAAHGALGSVRIVHDHADVRYFRRSDENQAVRADAEVAVRNVDGRCPRIRNGISFRDIAVYVVVPASVHLCEMHMLSFFLFQIHPRRGCHLYEALPLCPA